jgi:hypothetical protein
MLLNYKHTVMTNLSKGKKNKRATVHEVAASIFKLCAFSVPKSPPGEPA